MLVGEAPGREDDSTGKPFSGGSGKVLAALLRDAGISKSDCWTTTAVKCRPPNNRSPELDELCACQEYLAGEIKRINPRIIIALGDTASMLLGGCSTASHRGSIVEGIGAAAGVPVLVTLHPLATMKQKSMFPVVAWDLRKAREYKPTDDEYVGHYNYMPTRGEIEKTFNHIMTNNLETAVDIETAGGKEEGDKDALDPYAGEIIGIAFCWDKGKAMQLDTSTMLQNWDLVANFLTNHKLQIYANNIFDRTFCAVQKNTRPHCSWDVQDIMALIYTALPRKLDFLRSIYTNIPPYKHVYKAAAGGKYRPEKLSPIELARLNCLDVDVTWQVAQAQKQFIASHLPSNMIAEADMALDMRLTGVYIDKNNLGAHYASLLPEINRLESEFQETYGVSISSPQQLSELLYNRLKFKPPTSALTNKQTGVIKKYPSTDEKTIQELAHQCGLVYLDDEDGERFEGDSQYKDVLGHILQYRGLAKLASTYCLGLFKEIKSDGRVHPNWKIMGTPNGRWSCVNHPMQTFPKHMRNVVRAAPGKILMGADYKGIQIIGAAYLAEDWELVNKMMDPEYSLHNETMEAIRPSWPSIKKVQAKAVVFGTFFGRSPRDIAYTFHVPVKVAEGWQEAFYRTRPKLKKFFEEKITGEFKAKGKLTLPDGRTVLYDKVTEAKAAPAQNFESMVVKQAMRNLKAEGFNCILNIHDQLVVEEPDDENKEARYKRFIEIMETARPDLLPRFPTDGAMGYYWDEV